MTDKHAEGLLPRFSVHRRDARDMAGGDRMDADYFVLDATYDPHARAALRAYALSCQDDYPKLAEDLVDLAQSTPVFRSADGDVVASTEMSLKMSAMVQVLLGTGLWGGTREEVLRRLLEVALGHQRHLVGGYKELLRKWHARERQRHGEPQPVATETVAEPSTEDAS